MIKEKYKKLCLYPRFGGICVIVYTQTLCAMQRNREKFIHLKNKRKVRWQQQNN